MLLQVPSVGTLLQDQPIPTLPNVLRKIPDENSIQTVALSLQESLWERKVFLINNFVLADNVKD